MQMAMSGRAGRAFLLALVASVLLIEAAAAEKGRYYQITVVDDETGRGVPLVELETVNNIRYYTDSNGVVAFDEPGLMGLEVFFHVRSHGYEFPKDGFGYRGVRLRPVAGGVAEVKIKRVNIAERLYRITGQGIYADSVRLGLGCPTRNPVLNGQVLGQDSIQSIIYGGKVYWFWGDTNQAGYPLGQFAMSGATSLLPGKGGLDPSVGIDLEYFVDERGFSRKMAPMSDPGVVWLDGYLVVADEAGRERMLAHYMRLKDLGTPLEHGLMRFNDRSQTFEKVREFDLAAKWRCPRGHPVLLEGYYHFPFPFPTVRVKAEMKHVVDASTYEAFTCLEPGTRYDRRRARVERDGEGKLVYGWKANAEPITQKQERELIAAGKMKLEEARFQLRSVDGGKDVEMHTSSIAWNDYRKRWIMVGVEIGGTSHLGEVWYSEAESLTGPWTLGRKIVTHEKYTFYNVKHHPFLDQEGGRLVYFEGTFCNTFSGNSYQTPRYDYNQIMYRLDLGNRRLGLPLKQGR